MTPERIRAILAAYGADARRWPSAERAGAEALVRSDPAARGMVDHADRLDAALFDHHVAPPSAALQKRVLAAAPAPSAWSRALLWWSGVALALAAGAGTVAGATAAAFVPGADHLPSYAISADDDAS